MANLPTNYTDDILDVSVNTRRKFNMIQNQDGTVSFEDVTVYTNEGSNYGASNINASNREINKLNNKYDFLTGGFLLKDVPVNLSTRRIHIQTRELPLIH